MIESNAVFHDGKNPRSQAVRVVLTDRLEIRSNEDELLEFWDFDQIEVVDHDKHVLRLAQIGRKDDARLRVVDPGFPEQLFATVPDLVKRRHKDRRVARAIAFWSVAAAMSILVFTFVGIPYLADKLAPLIPASLEARLGDNAKPQIYQVFSITDEEVCRDPEGQKILDDLVARLSRNSDNPFDISIEMVSHKMPNAFALPGGQIVVLNSLLKKMPNGDAFAAVIAHEIGHIANRDIMRSILETGGRSFLLSTVLGDFTGSTIAIAVADQLVSASYSRERESAADAFAVEHLARAGANPFIAHDALEALVGKEEASSLNRLLSSHPVGPDRLAALKEMAEGHPVQTSEPLVTDAQWDVLKTMCKKDAS